MLNRRKFIALQSAALLGLSLKPSSVLSMPTKSSFQMSLNPGAIGVQATQQELLDYAIQYNFQAILCLPSDLLKMETGEMKTFLDKMDSHKISWGSSGLPIDFRKDESTYQNGLKGLPVVASKMEKAGATRMNTWIMPTQDSRTYLENFKLHKKRIKEISNILGHHGIRFGLEYVGPKTLMSRDKYSFIRSMAEVKELIEVVQEKNLGIVLDSFHWFCAGESPADILTLDKEDIVTVDLNDARLGISADEQIDGKRELPGATGVIDLKGFLGALKSLGYEGPLRAEPFNKVLNEMDNEQALKATHKAMSKSFALV